MQIWNRKPWTLFSTKRFVSLQTYMTLSWEVQVQSKGLLGSTTQSSCVSSQNKESSDLCFVESDTKHVVRAIFVWSWKMDSVSVRYLTYQPMVEKIKTWLLRFPAKENPNMDKALFDWPIVLQYDVNVKYRLISRKFSGMKFFYPSVRLTNQKPRAFVSVR